MISPEKQTNPEEKNIVLQGTPDELLKTLESFKAIGMKTIKCEFAFNMIQEVEIFTRILNRQQEQERVANQLKTTYFHHIRGKVQKLEIVKDEQYSSVRQIAFTSNYHAHLFMKYYHNRIQQIQNEYRYKIIEGKAGHLLVYMNEENVSSLFLNEILDMKKRLRFLQIKDPELCQKFIYSEKLGNELRKQKIYYEIWYKGKQSTIIFYSENIHYLQIKNTIDLVSKYHVTILKMIDYRFSFLINYLLFGLMKKMIEPELKNMKTIDSQFVEVNQNKIGIVLHDRHECFAQDQIGETLEIVKKIFFINIKARQARNYYNLLKKQFTHQQFVNFCYSKKNVCLCIHVGKVTDWQKLRKMLNGIGQCLDIESHIVINFFHLLEKQISDYRKQFIENIAMIFTESNFIIENFQKFVQDRDRKCILKVKNFSKRETLAKNISDIFVKLLANCYKIQTISQNSIKPLIKQNKQNFQETLSQQNDQKSQSSNNQSDFEQEGQQDQLDAESSIHQNLGDQFGQNLLNLKSQEHQAYLNSFHQKLLIKSLQILSIKFFEGTEQWKEGKRLKSFEEGLSISSRLLLKIHNVMLQDSFKENLKDLQEMESSLFYYPFEQFPQNFSEENLKHELIIKSVLKLNLNKKYMIVVELQQNPAPLIRFPLFTIEILNMIN